MSANDILALTYPFLTPLGPLFSAVIGVSIAFKVVEGVRKLFIFKGM